MDFDKRGGWNKRGGWKIFMKSINVEGGFFCGGWNFSKCPGFSSRSLFLAMNLKHALILPKLLNKPDSGNSLTSFTFIVWP